MHAAGLEGNTHTVMCVPSKLKAQRPDSGLLTDWANMQYERRQHSTPERKVLVISTISMYHSFSFS